MRRACIVESEDVELHIKWYGCYITAQGDRSTRLQFRSVSRGLGVRPTIVGLVLRDAVPERHVLALVAHGAACALAVCRAYLE